MDDPYNDWFRTTRWADHDDCHVGDAAGEAWDAALEWAAKVVEDYSVTDSVGVLPFADVLSSIVAKIRKGGD